jgi:hypothetical protein
VPSVKKIKKKSTSSKKTKKKPVSRSVKKTKKNISKNVDVNLMAFKWPKSLSNPIPYTEDTIFPNHSYDYQQSLQQSLDPQQSQIIPYNPYSAYQESPQQYITPNTKSPMKCTTKTSTSNGIVMKTTICKCDGVDCIGSSNTHSLFDSIINMPHMPHMIQMEGGRRKKRRPHRI